MAEVTATRSELASALRSGSDAAKAGKPATDCPHSPSSDDPNERVLASAWVHGYIKAANLGG